MGAFVIAAIGQLKFTGTTRASFSRMPSTQKTNGEKIMLLTAMLNVIFHLFFFPLSQERSRWLLLVGFAVFVPYSIMDSV